MSLTTLPKELLVVICKNFHTWPDYDIDDSDIDEDTYPFAIHSLFASCKHFQWLTEYEFIHVKIGELCTIYTTVNIKGQNHGMEYMFRGVLDGFWCYKEGQTIGDYTGLIDLMHYCNVRDINGKLYDDPDECVIRSHRKHKIPCVCLTCKQMDPIKQQIFKINPMIQEIENCSYDDYTYYSAIIMQVKQPVPNFTFSIEGYKIHEGVYKDDY